MKSINKKKDNINCLKATDNQNWWSSVDTNCSLLEGYSNISGKYESFDNFGTKYEEITLANISDIHSIQELEKTIYDKLNKENLDNDQKKTLMNELLQMNTIKTNLYKTLNTLYDTYKNQVGTTTQAVTDQLNTITLVESELTELSNKMISLNQDNYSKLRLIEINRYYGEKYDDHAGFMKYLIIFIIFYLVLYLLKKNFLIKENVYSILLFILVFIGIIVLGRYFYRMIFRSNMEYNQYQFPFANILGTKYSPVTTNTTNPNPWESTNPQTICPSTYDQTQTSFDQTSTDETSTDTSAILHPVLLPHHHLLESSESLPNSQPLPASTCKTKLSKMVYGNNGSVTCDAYCGGINGGSFNGELPAEWNGAKCVGTGGSAESAGCFDTFTNNPESPGNCLCQKTGKGWN